MKLRNFLVMLLGIFLADLYGPVNAASSKSITGLKFGTMSTYKKTTGQVYHLEEDAFVPGNILYSEDHSLMTTNGRTSHLIVGSSYGYVEGRSSQAKFNTLTGFLQINSNELFLVDHRNYCVRQVNRITNQTSTLFGTCQTQGFSDGQFQNSRFNLPYTVIRNLMDPDTVIVTDWGNNALRSIGLVTGDVRTLLKDLPGPPAGAAFDSDKENVFITFDKFVMQFNLKTLTSMTIKPINKYISMDSIFRGITCVNTVCIVADSKLDKTDVLDFSKQLVHPICNYANPAAAGATTSCSSSNPYGLLLTSDTLFIGGKYAIRSVSVSNRFSCEDIAVTLSSEEQQKCVTVTPGHTICLPFGVYRYIIEEENCTIQINISRERDACWNNPCLNSGKCTAGKNNAYTCFCTDGWSGTNCQIEPTLKERLDIKADYNISCNVLKGFKDLVTFIARTRYRQINMITSGYCNSSTFLQSCDKNVLSITWPTNCIIPSNVLNKPTLVKSITDFLRQNNGAVLDFLVPNHDPPIVYPISSPEGLPASLILTPVCPGGLNYVKAVATCQ